MSFEMIVPFFTLLTVVSSGQESGHGSDDIVVVVMMVKLNLLIRFWSFVDNAVKEVFRNDGYLIVWKYRLKLFKFLDTTWSSWYVGSIMDLLR